MGNVYANPNMEKPVENPGSSLRSAGGHGSEREKRGPVREYLSKLNEILSILPEDSKNRISEQVGRIKKDHHSMVEIIRKEIEAQQEVVNILNQDGISTEDALKQLENLLPKNKVQ